MNISESPASGERIKGKNEGESHVARIEGHLGRVFRAHGFEGVDMRTPLGDLLKKESGNDEPDDDAEAEEARLLILRRLMQYMFEAGPHPGKVMQRAFAVARAYYPKLIADMNGSDLAIIFDETRAAVSARCTLMFTDRLKRVGAKGSNVPFQKAASARAKYSAAAKGNKNRLGKKIARLARAEQ